MISVLSASESALSLVSLALRSAAEAPLFSSLLAVDGAKFDRDGSDLSVRTCAAVAKGPVSDS